jgi:hypothetical protein
MTLLERVTRKESVVSSQLRKVLRQNDQRCPLISRGKRAFTGMPVVKKSMCDESFRSRSCERIYSYGRRTPLTRRRQSGERSHSMLEPPAGSMMCAMTVQTTLLVINFSSVPMTSTAQQFVSRLISLRNDHTTMTAPHPVRSGKLSIVWPG